MKNLFGTTGVRGIFNEEFNAEMALNLGEALGTYLEGENIILGSDARTSAPIIRSALSAGSNSCGSNVYDCGIITTPTVAYLTKKLKFKAGVMVTASHNPPEYIGVKFWSNTGLGFTREKEEIIEKIFFSKKFNKKNWDKIGEIYFIDNPDLMHVEDIISRIDADLIKTKKYKIALDVGGGAAYKIAPILLKELNSKIISINNQPDGFFSGRPSKPSKDNLYNLLNIVKNAKCDLGIAFDGDADRIVFIDEKGTYIPGDVILASLSRYLLKFKTGKIVTTLESSLVVEEVVKKYGGELIWTPIGDINVGETLKKVKGIIGGEECGVFIWPEFHLGPDSIYTLAKILEILSKENIRLSELVEGIESYPVFRDNILVNNNEKGKVIREIDSKVSDLEEILSINRIDGLNIKFNQGRVLIRPSGTEPLIRITVESKNEKWAEIILNKIKNVIKN